MTILIINNYYKKRNLNKVDQIASALKQIGETKHVIWGFSEIDNKKIPDNLEAVILSGSAARLKNQVVGPDYTIEIEFLKKIQVPILGICFGHQLIAKAFGSKIESLEHPSTNFQKITIVEPDEIFSSWKAGDEILVCQHHQDYIANPPEGFICLAVSHTQSRKIVEGMKHKIKPIYGVQAHIERAKDQHPAGRLLLKNFIVNVVEKIKAEEFKKKVEESEENYGVSDIF